MGQHSCPACCRRPAQLFCMLHGAQLACSVTVAGGLKALLPCGAPDNSRHVCWGHFVGHALRARLLWDATAVGNHTCATNRLCQHARSLAYCAVILLLGFCLRACMEANLLVGCTYISMFVLLCARSFCCRGALAVALCGLGTPTHTIFDLCSLVGSCP